MQWYLEVLKKYVVFNGRSRRKEYWMFALFNIIIYVVLGFIERLLKMPGILTGLYTLAVLLPAIAVTIRRLHDTARTGWWILIGLVPVVGTIVILIFMVLEGTHGENQYGADPKQAEAVKIEV